MTRFHRIRGPIAKTISVVALAALACAVVAAWVAGGRLTAPNPSSVGPPPADLSLESVEFASASGSTIHGWFSVGQPGRGAVILLHSLHGSRRTMLGRVGFLERDGFSVLLVDFQANGERPGEHVTFGHLESRDARAAVDFMRARLPGERVGIVGTSLGAAAAVLADPPLDVDALVLEAMYPTIDDAVADRLRLRAGSVGSLLAPVLTLQLWPRLGVAARDLRPIDRVGLLSMPKLFVAGSDDQHTRLEESRALYDRAAEPKSLWVVDGAPHVDFHAAATVEYEARVGSFLRDNLARP